MNAFVPLLSAKLWVYRDGVLLHDSPISPDRELQELRSDASQSWNFLLPSVCTASDAEQPSFTMRVVVEVNPAGPDSKAECHDCASDNQISLDG